MKTNLAGLLVVLALCYPLARFEQKPGPALLVLAILAVVLEQTASRLPGFGFFTAAPAVVLAAGLTLGTGPALMLALGAVLLRTLTRGPSLAEALSDLLPTLGALALTLLFPGFVARGLALALGWAILATLVPGMLAATLSEADNALWGAARSRLLLPILSLGLLALPMALAIQQNPYYGLAFLPALAALASLAGRAALVEDPGEAGQVDRKVARVRETVQQLQKVTFRQAEQLRSLEQLSRSFTHSEALGTTLETILSMASRVADCESVVIFLQGPQGLEPSASRTPHQQRLEQAPFTQLKEPLVERAMITRLPASLGRLEPGPRIFEGEASAVALLLEEQGVLYCGRRREGGFEEEERSLLDIVAAQAAVAIQSARRQASESRALAEHRQVNARLSRWLERTAHLLEGARELASTLEPDELARLLEAAVRRVVPHQYGTFGQRAWGADFDPQAVQAVAATVQANRLPLLLEDVGQSRFSPLVPEQRSLLAAPMRSAVLILGSDRPGVFQREDQDLLVLLGYLAAVHFTNADTHHKLKESQDQLIQSSKMAAVGQLAAGVAHELNTPLGAAVISLDSILTRSQNFDLAEKKIRRAMSALSVAQNIIQKLLIYCRPNPGGPERVDVALLLEDTLMLLDSQLESEGMVLRREFAQVPPVRANPTELQQVLTNLLVNARDAAREPGARGREILLATRTDGKRVWFAVQDQGPGVPAEVADRIFEPFFTTKPVGKGTGLGLSISREIMLRQGGTLELDRSYQGGARFVLSLAAADEPSG